MHRRILNMLCMEPDDGAAGGAAAAGSGTNDDGGQSSANGAGASADATSKTSGETLPITKEELDKHTAKAIETVLKKAEEDKAEAERLAKMSKEEKEKEEFRKSQEEFKTQKLDFFTDRLLSEKQLPAELKPFIMGTDEEKTKERAEVFSGLFTAAVESAINERLKGKTPPNPGNTYKKPIDEMSMEEYQAWYNERKKK